MDADFSVELGADDNSLEVPWADPDDGPRYFDLKHLPELLKEIEECQRSPELGEFLASMNSKASPFETAKCDAWSTTEMAADEDIFNAKWKFGSYVDLLFSAIGARFSFEAHEQLAKRVVQLLRRVPEIPAAAEFIVRRCYFRGADACREGFYITFYLFGYGSDEEQARRQWAIGLELVDNALKQRPSR